jgi:hypothetical protein
VAKATIRRGFLYPQGNCCIPPPQDQPRYQAWDQCACPPGTAHSQETPFHCPDGNRRFGMLSALRAHTKAP